MATHRRLVLAGLIFVLLAALVAGSAARPASTRFDAQPQTCCGWVWDALLLLWCYRCCDVYGCYYLECTP